MIPGESKEHREQRLRGYLILADQGKEVNVDRQEFVVIVAKQVFEQGMDDELAWGFIEDVWYRDIDPYTHEGTRGLGKFMAEVSAEYEKLVKGDKAND